MSHLPRQVELIVGAPYPEYFEFLEGTDGFQVVSLALRGDTPWARMAAMHTQVPLLAQRHSADLVMGPNFIAHPDPAVAY